jgi:hypothetical protein
LFHFLPQAGAVEEGGGLRGLETRLNNRENPFMFRDAMLKLLLAETPPYAKLISDQG